jgi:hypothetical protein
MQNSLLKLEDSRFSIAVFDAEAVLFDCLSGDTHYLDPLAFARLQGVSRSDIVSRIEGEDESSLEEPLNAIDAQLRDWGLAV